MSFDKTRSMPTQRPGVISRAIGDEYVVVNTDTNEAHALEGDAAIVWRASLSGAMPDLDPRVVAPIVSDLQTLGLLDEPNGLPRRTLLKHVGIVGAGVVGTSIASIALPTAAMAASAQNITLSPTFGTTGSTVQVTGSGFPGSSTIAISFNGAGITVGGNATTNASGQITGTSFTVPNIGPGSYTVNVTAGGKTATATFQINPSLTLTPKFGPDGTSVVFSGSNYVHSGSIASVKFDANSIAFTAATTSASGTINGSPTFTVPAGAAGSIHNVSVTDSANNTGLALFYAAKITLSASSAIKGDTITLTGSGFTPSSGISATLNGNTLTLTGNTGTSAGGVINGSPQFVVPPNGVNAGTNTVVLTDGSGVQASATFSYTAPTASSNPSSIKKKTTGSLVLSGSGFAKNSTVTVTALGSGGVSTAGTATQTFSTNASGTFSGNYSLTVDNNTGTATLTLTDIPGNTTTTAVTVTNN